MELLQHHPTDLDVIIRRWIQGADSKRTSSYPPICCDCTYLSKTKKKQKKNTKRAQNVHASATVTVHFHTGIASKVVRALDIKQDVVVKKG